MKLLVGSWEKLGIWSSTLFEKMNIILNRKIEFLEQNSRQLKHSQKSEQEANQKLKQELHTIHLNPLSKQSFNLRRKFSELKETSNQQFAEISKITEGSESNKTLMELQLLKQLEALKAMRENYMACIEKSFEHILEMKTALEK
jgi:hypothetical protein